MTILLLIFIIFAVLWFLSIYQAQKRQRVAIEGHDAIHALVDESRMRGAALSTMINHQFKMVQSGDEDE